MKRLIYIIGGILLFMVSCISRKSTNAANVSGMDSVAVTDSMRPDMPPPPSDSENFDGHRPPPPPDGMHHDGPPPHDHEEYREPDNMRGFDPASEDDMLDNGMSRYMENNDEEGWD